MPETCCLAKKRIITETAFPGGGKAMSPSQVPSNSSARNSSFVGVANGRDVFGGGFGDGTSANTQRNRAVRSQAATPPTNEEAWRCFRHPARFRAGRNRARQTRGINAGRAVKRVHFKSGIIRQDERKGPWVAPKPRGNVEKPRASVPIQPPFWWRCPQRSCASSMTAGAPGKSRRVM